MKSIQNFIILFVVGEGTPQYARPTTSSMQRYRKTPPEDNYLPEPQSVKSAPLKSTKNSKKVDILTISHTSEGINGDREHRVSGSFYVKYRSSRDVVTGGGGGGG